MQNSRLLKQIKKDFKLKCKRRHKKLFSRVVLNFFLYRDTFKSYFSLLKKSIIVIYLLIFEDIRFPEHRSVSLNTEMQEASIECND